MTSRTSFAGALMALFIGVFVVVGISEGLLRVLFPHWHEFYSGRFMTVSHVPDYGIVLTGRSGFDGYFAQNNGDFRVRIRINDAGLRNDEPVSAADGRLWVIGDSMAFGWGVERDQTYTSVIARQTGVPTYNIASPGTDVCGYQALAARMPKSTRPSAVIVGLILENDVLAYDCPAQARVYAQQWQAGHIAAEEETTRFPTSLGTLKRLLTRTSALYNFLAVAVKRVDVFEALLIRIGVVKPAHNDHYAPAGRDQDELVRRTVRALARLRAMFPSIPFAVLIAPARFEIRDGNPSYAELREKIAGELRAADIGVIDPVDRFRAEGLAPTHFAHDGHWSAPGHRIAGEAAAAWIKSLPPSALTRSSRINARPE